MDPSSILQGNYVKEVKTASSQRKLSRALDAFLAVSQLIFGFNFGFVESRKRFKMAARILITAAGCTMMVILFLSFTSNVVGSPSYLVYLVQYIPIFIILRMAKYTLHDFLTDLLAKIGNAGEIINDKVGMVVWFYFFLLYVAKIATSIVFLSITVVSYTNWLIVNTVIHVAIICLDIIPVVNFIIFYHVYAHIKYLRKKYEHREINLKQLQSSYKGVADNFEKFRKNYDAIFVWGFLADSTKWMLFIWEHLILMNNSSSWWLYGCSYIWSMFVTIHICVPAVFAEMISVQTDAMKMILHEQLLVEVETDETKSYELTRLLRYVEARPLLRKAWRLVPVDLRLPITMLSICTTYLIVIVQFTHLFD